MCVYKRKMERNIYTKVKYLYEREREKELYYIKLTSHMKGDHTAFRSEFSLKKQWCGVLPILCAAVCTTVVVNLSDISPYL